MMSLAVGFACGKQSSGTISGHVRRVALAHFRCRQARKPVPFLRFETDSDNRKVPVREKNLKPPLLLALKGLLIGKELAD